MNKDVPFICVRVREGGVGGELSTADGQSSSASKGATQLDLGRLLKGGCVLRDAEFKKRLADYLRLDSSAVADSDVGRWDRVVRATKYVNTAAESRAPDLIAAVPHKISKVAPHPA